MRIPTPYHTFPRSARLASFGGLLIVAAVVLQGCATMDDFTTYFNIYWNAQRIMTEIEEPDAVVEAPRQLAFNAAPTGMAQPPGQQQQQKAAPSPVKPPEYYDQLIRNPVFDAQRRAIGGTVASRTNAVAQGVKLDSVVNKCTKILKFHSNSSYVPPAFYMMAKAFYYKGKQTDFLYSKQKAEEFIQLFPDHDLTVDAHLLLAEDLIALKDNEEARRALSRCIDIALPRKRYDVVSKALRYTADLAMQRGDLEGAVRPYLHAMMLSHNSEANAAWQLEIGTLNLVVGHDADAAQAFRDVMKYEPDLFTEFSSQFGLGIALRQLKQYDVAQKQLEMVRDKGAYSQWKNYAEMELATVRWVRGEQPEAADEYKRIDTANVGAEVAARAQFEWGMRAMLATDYGTAKGRFEKVRATMFPYAKEAERLYNVLVVGDAASRDIINLEGRLAGNDSVNAGRVLPMIDSIRTPQAAASGATPGAPSTFTPENAPAPIVSIETGLPPGVHPDSLKKDSTVRVVNLDSLAAVKRQRDSAVAAMIVARKTKTRDSIRTALSNSYYEVARMFFLLGHEDSMVAYYKRIIALGGPGDAVPTTLYSYALYLREKGREPLLVDTLMQAIVDRFPKTKFAPMARMHLGLTDEERIDSAETGYISGERFMQIHDDTTAILRFLRVWTMFPASDYAPQALYAVGWIFETEFAHYDSAKFYYALLVKLYPNSEYAKRVKPLLAFAVDTGHHEAPVPSMVPSTPGGKPVMSPAPGAMPPASGAPPPQYGNPLPPGVVIRNNPRFPMRGKEQPGPYPGATPPIPPDSVKHHTGPQ